MNVIYASLKVENIWEINTLTEWPGLTNSGSEVALYNIQARVERVLG